MDAMPNKAFLPPLPEPLLLYKRDCVSERTCMWGYVAHMCFCLHLQYSMTLNCIYVFVCVCVCVHARVCACAHVSACLLNYLTQQLSVAGS